MRADTERVSSVSGRHLKCRRKRIKFIVFFNSWSVEEIRYTCSCLQRLRVDDKVDKSGCVCPVKMSCFTCCFSHIVFVTGLMFLHHLHYLLFIVIVFVINLFISSLWNMEYCIHNNSDALRDMTKWMTNAIGNIHQFVVYCLIYLIHYFILSFYFNYLFYVIHLIFA